MKTRLFISHSNRDGQAVEFVGRLTNAAKKLGLDVLVDCETLKPGAEWRDEIYTWMGLCDAAVLVLSPSVLDPARPWAAREASVLIWRRTLDPAFPLIPVYLGDLAPADINSGAFADMRLEEIQSVAVRGTVDFFVATVCDRLDALAVCRSTPLESVAEQAAALLAGIAKPLIGAAMDRLGIDLGPWDPHGRPHHALALRLLQVDLKSAAAALQSLAGHMPSKEIADRILALIAPSWVDLCAARWLAHCARWREARPAVLVNAETGFAAQMYVQRASCKPPGAWPMVPYTGVHGEDTAADAIAEIKDALIREFRLEADLFVTGDLEAELEDLLEVREQRGDPVFVVLKLSPTVRNVLGQLQQHLPRVTFVVLTGEDVPAPKSVAGLHFRIAEPRLAPGIEREARSDYNYARSLLAIR